MEAASRLPKPWLRRSASTCEGQSALGPSSPQDSCFLYKRKEKFEALLQPDCEGGGSTERRPFWAGSTEMRFKFTMPVYSQTCLAAEVRHL
jgi:hypothetical protein